MIKITITIEESTDGNHRTSMEVLNASETKATIVSSALSAISESIKNLVEDHAVKKLSATAPKFKRHKQMTISEYKSMGVEKMVSEITMKEISE